MSTAILAVVIIAGCLAAVQSAGCPPFPHDPELEELKKSQPSMLIGIGAQKSGSTFLFSALTNHPRIVGSNMKEIHSFDKEEFRPTVKGYKNYLRHWNKKWEAKGSPKDPWFMEFTPKYLTVADAPCRLKHFFPNARFIVTLREPVARTLSAIAMKRRFCGPNDRWKERWPGCCGTDFRSSDLILADALEALESKKKECMDPFIEAPWRDCPLEMLEPISRCFYGSQIAWWLKHFDASQFIFINAKELHDNPQRELNRVAKFLGLEKFGRLNIARMVSNSAKTYYTEPGINKIATRFARVLEAPNQQLYRLLKENGHDFTPFQPEKKRSNIKGIPLAVGVAKCCSRAKNAQSCMSNVKRMGNRNDKDAGNGGRNDNDKDVGNGGRNDNDNDVGDGDDNDTGVGNGGRNDNDTDTGDDNDNDTGDDNDNDTGDDNDNDTGDDNDTDIGDGDGRGHRTDIGDGDGKGNRYDNHTDIGDVNDIGNGNRYDYDYDIGDGNGDGNGQASLIEVREGNMGYGWFMFFSITTAVVMIWWGWKLRRPGAGRPAKDRVSRLPGTANA